MIAAKRAALEEAAKKIKEALPWADLPKLASIFEHRPVVNTYWLELAEAVRILMHGPSIGEPTIREIVLAEAPAVAAERDVTMFRRGMLSGMKSALIPFEKLLSKPLEDLIREADAATSDEVISAAMAEWR